jgi:lipoprotein-anchoring transpeptidase ErfK/SrfK
MSHIDDSTGQKTLIGKGYAGHGTGLNNPEMQNLHNTGPLPEGNYTIGKQGTTIVYDAYGRPRSLSGAMRLTPNPNNQMYGRQGFLIHGGNFNAMTSSQGCIVLPLNVRNQIGLSGDRALTVTR